MANGETGLARLRYERPDVCVLDLMLPGLDGWKVIEQARGEGIGTPIVVVSARGTEHDRVHALEIGADDYLVKPFSMKELVARVGAAARRGTRAQDPRRGEEIVIEELRLDPKNVQAYVDGASADLTPTEFRLIYTLALDAGRVLTRDELLQRVWGRRASHRDRTVDVFVRKLREKIDAAPRGTRSCRRATAWATSSRPSSSSASPPPRERRPEPGEALGRPERLRVVVRLERRDVVRQDDPRHLRPRVDVDVRRHARGPVERAAADEEDLRPAVLAEDRDPTGRAAVDPLDAPVVARGIDRLRCAALAPPRGRPRSAR